MSVTSFSETRPTARNRTTVLDTAGRGSGASRRFTRHDPCPVCGGFDEAGRGRGARCYGFLSSDGKYAHCSREEVAGLLRPDPNGNTYAHLLEGECRCGNTHGLAPVAPAPVVRAERSARIVATYDYRDEDGQLLYQVVRFDPKSFRQRKPDGLGGWVWSLAGVRRVPYRLPELIAADRAETVWVSPSEKDVENLRALGLVATCNSEGDGKWQDAFAVHLAGREVVVVPHNDESSRSDADRIAASLAPHAEVRTLHLAGLPEGGGDVSDWLAAGNTVAMLREFASWVPTVQRRVPPTVDRYGVVGL